MPKTLRSPRHVRLIDLIVEQRNRVGLSQAELAAKLGRYQSVVSQIESGGRRADVIELLDIAAIIDLDVHAVIEHLLSINQSSER